MYVDGVCCGNFGFGGWGVYIIIEIEEYKLCGGEDNIINNCMEFIVVIEGIFFCLIDVKLVVWIDLIYVKCGIIEWIMGWKKKNWKDVKNLDLWKKFDVVC